jgi:hypothetical protein
VRKERNGAPVEKVQVTFPVRASLERGVDHRIIYAVAVGCNSDAQHFVSLVRNGDEFVAFEPLTAPWGPLSTYRADLVHAYLMDQLWIGLLTNIGVQGDLGLVTGP